MNRREFIKTAGMGAAALAASKAFGVPCINLGDKRPPNILFILTDQQRFDALGAAGNRLMRTPTLDKLCREGVRFDRTYVAQALCSPSRASIFSGLFPHTHKVQDNVYGIDDATSDPKYNMGATWPLLLQQAGYHTGYIGKWHLGEKGPKCFDEWHGFNSLLSHWMGEEYKSRYRSDYETDLGIDFLERNKNRPFVLCQSYYPPHTPYNPPEEYVRQYRGTILRPAKYYGGVSAVDKNVGRLLRRLDDLDLMDNTLIIFTSDHGDHFGKRPGGGNKRGAYDECARVPLIMHYPGLFQGGSVRPEPVSNVDLMPTILEVAGVESPGGLQGRSLKSTVTGRAAVCIENREDVEQSNVDCDSRGVRTGMRKLILRERLSVRAKSLQELYDSISDPAEKKNIYGPGEAAEIEKILQQLESWA